MRGAVSPGCLELEHHLPGGAGLHALVGQRGPSDVPAQLHQRLAVIGCAAHGGVEEDEMLMALTVADLQQALAGMDALAGNGLRYPFAQYGLQQDVGASMAVSYPKRIA